MVMKKYLTIHTDRKVNLVSMFPRWLLIIGLDFDVVDEFPLQITKNNRKADPAYGKEKKKYF